MISVDIPMAAAGRGECDRSDWLTTPRQNSEGAPMLPKGMARERLRRGQALCSVFAGDTMGGEGAASPGSGLVFGVRRRYDGWENKGVRKQRCQESLFWRLGCGIFGECLDRNAPMKRTASTTPSIVAMLGR